MDDQKMDLKEFQSLQECSDVLQIPSSSSSNYKIKKELEDPEFNFEDVHHTFDIKEDFSSLDSQLKEENSEELITEKRLPKETFACEVCDYKSSFRQNLKRHMKTHTGEKSSACEYPMCGFKCSATHHLKLHVMRSHTGEKPFRCEVCDYACLLKSDLVRHIRTHTGEKPFSCDTCNFKCVTKYTLMRHTRTHTGEKPSACEMCDYKSSVKQYLKEHIMRIHTGEKPFACGNCDYKCMSKQVLQQHIRRTHTGEKPFQCHICLHKCSEKRALKHHILRNHTGEKPFACNVCDYKSCMRCDLKQHIRTHTGEKPYRCNICESKSYFNKQDLMKHIMRLHSPAKPLSGLVNHDLKERMRTAIKQLFVSNKWEK